MSTERPRRAAPREMPRLEESRFFRTSKPLVRWWWFNERLEPAEIERQLRWVAANGFGGVEIAWVYPVPGREPGPRWLSPQWSALVAGARREAERLGLVCDLTFGSLWPFGDSSLSGPQASQWFDGPSPQRIDRHWETRELPGGPPVMNHLDRAALAAMGSRFITALGPALDGEPPCLFSDSWEVEEEGRLWTAGFGERFKDRFGYAVEPLMGTLDQHPAERHDYRVLLADYALDEFYRPYPLLCRHAGAFSRVQCHGAPTDILAAYAEADVPESEALLFDPAFSRIAASAAAMTGKELVSAEAFTCLYGWNPWPATGPWQGEEKVADLRLLADALMANGVNRIMWHGMPYSAPERPNRFYASVHVGPDGALAPHLPAFNVYLEECSDFLRAGTPSHRVACLLPLADVRMQGELPASLRKPSARWWWELQHPLLSESLSPWSPLWVTEPFLRRAESLGDGSVRLGSATVMALVVDAHFLDRETAGHLARLAAAGVRMVLTRKPKEPGRAQHADYDSTVSSLLGGGRVRVCAEPRDGLRDVPPFLLDADGLSFCVRAQGGDALVFAAHPAATGIRYPMPYDAASRAAATRRPLRFVTAAGGEVGLEMDFAPGASCSLRISRAGAAGRALTERGPF